MPKNGFKVLDSDMHILEPPDLWQRFIDSKFKDYAPRGTTDHVRDLRLVGPDGRAWAGRWTLLRNNSSAGSHLSPQSETLQAPYGTGLELSSPTRRHG